MRSTPPAIHRAQASLKKNMQEGTIVSFTTVHHPPEGFPESPRTIGLIELTDGSKVMGQLMTTDAQEIAIGMKVTPTMRLSQVNKDGLRSYAVAYEVPVQKPVQQEFPGYLLALTGPSGVGKTSVSLLLATKVGSYVERVPIVTTRDPKDSDEDEYIHVSTEEFLELKQEGKLAAFTSIPSSDEKRWYGYRQSDIDAIWQMKKVPVVITEMHLLQGLVSTLGRRSVLSFGLLPPGKSKRQMLSSLLHRLRERGRDTETQISDRMKNAEADLKFFEEKKDLFDDLIINDELEKVVENLSTRVLQVSNA